MLPSSLRDVFGSQKLQCKDGRKRQVCDRFQGSLTARRLAVFLRCNMSKMALRCRTETFAVMAAFAISGHQPAFAAGHLPARQAAITFDAYHGRS